MTKNPPKPAYREPWFWMVMAPLLGTVVLSSVFMTVAFFGADDRIHDDYYKQGRTINKQFAAEQQAVAMNVSAHLDFDATAREVRLQLEGDQPPDWVELLVSHPAEADLDQVFVLRPSGYGRYIAALPEPISGRRYLVVTGKMGADDTLWRLNSEIDFDARSSQDLSVSAKAASIR